MSHVVENYPNPYWRCELETQGVIGYKCHHSLSVGVLTEDLLEKDGPEPIEPRVESYRPSDIRRTIEEEVDGG